KGRRVDHEQDLAAIGAQRQRGTVDGGEGEIMGASRLAGFVGGTSRLGGQAKHSARNRQDLIHDCSPMFDRLAPACPYGDWAPHWQLRERLRSRNFNASKQIGEPTGLLNDDGAPD